MQQFWRHFKFFLVSKCINPNYLYRRLGDGLETCLVLLSNTILANTILPSSELKIVVIPNVIRHVSPSRESTVYEFNRRIIKSANQEWQLRSNAVVPHGSRIGVQKAWGTPLVNRKLEEVISAISYTNPSRTRPSYRGCCTTLRWFPACDSLLCSRYATWQHLLSHRLFTASRGHHVCLAHVRLRRRSRLLRDSRPCLSQVRRSSHATQRRQWPYQTGTGVSGHPCPVGAKIVIKGWW